MPRVVVRVDGELAVVTFDEPVEGEFAKPVIPRIDAAEEIRSGRAVSFESLTEPTDARAESTVDGRQFLAWGPNVFNEIVNRTPNGKACLDPRPVTHEINTPDWNGQTSTGVFRPKLGITGFGGGENPGDSLDRLNPRRTSWRIKPNTASKQHNMLGGAFQFGYSGGALKYIANAHFEGTDQGYQSPSYTGVKPGLGNDGKSHRTFTNGFWWNAIDGARLIDCLSTGHVGNNGGPPGETFPFQMYADSNDILRDPIMARVASDGRQRAGGPITGAAGPTFGHTLRAIGVDITSHHNMAAAFVAFESIEGMVWDLRLGEAGDTTAHQDGFAVGQDGLNLELTDNWTFIRPAWLTAKYPTGKPDSPRQVVPITHSGDGLAVPTGGNIPADQKMQTAKGRLTIVDPDYRGVMTSGGQKPVWIQSWNPYRSRPSNMTALNPPVVRKMDGTLLRYRRSIDGNSWVNVNAS